MNCEMCNSGNSSYKYVDYLFLKIGFGRRHGFMCSNLPQVLNQIYRQWEDLLVK